MKLKADGTTAVREREQAAQTSRLGKDLCLNNRRELRACGSTRRRGRWAGATWKNVGDRNGFQSVHMEGARLGRDQDLFWRSGHEFAGGWRVWEVRGQYNRESRVSSGHEGPWLRRKRTTRGQCLWHWLWQPGPGHELCTSGERGQGDPSATSEAQSKAP